MQTFSAVLCGCLLAGIVLCFYYLLRERPDNDADQCDDLGYLQNIIDEKEFF